MAHIEDMWVKDGERRPRHGTGRRYRVRWVDPGGSERSRSFARKTDADRFRSSTEADLDRDEYIDPRARKITLRQFSETWLAAQTFSEASREVTERRLRLHIWPLLGDKLLRQITPSVIQAWVRGLGTAPSTTQVLLTLLSSVLGAAVDDGLIAKNQTRARSVKAPKTEQRRIEPWSAERVAAVRDGLSERFRAMADCGAGLGMRQGEVLGVALDDIDFLRRVVHVRRQVMIVGGRRCFGPPKNGKEREVPLPDEVGLRLAAHIAAYPPVSITLPWQAGRQAGDREPRVHLGRVQGDRAQPLEQVPVEASSQGGRCPCGPGERLSRTAPPLRQLAAAQRRGHQGAGRGAGPP